MITDITIEYAEDLFSENTVMFLHCFNAQKTTFLSGGTWQTKNSSLTHVFQYVFSVIKESLPTYEVWILVGDSAWQPDTRVARYYKLWGRLRRRGIVLPSQTQSFQEVIQSSNGELKFFGIAQAVNVPIDIIERIVLKEYCAYVVALPNQFDSRDLLRKEWVGNIAEDLDHICHFSKHGGVFFRRYGEFDDREKGILAVGQPEFINILCSDMTPS